ncbi:Divergent AAA domain protein [Posidoniimonas corsicana]|uniref:Divergent AAA domain protein n=2 Tax=Posidoniimonas corsicana TaxID=1938618 RepID=A0A5C5UVX3_9BACT|nr:Divergent AAA domain protein [Posidoniimonas corsicana]
MSVTPKGLSVQAAYRDYTDGKFVVNRKYQRKLVWTREEKQKLIDSILRGFPIPLILLATETLPDGSKSYEILDGLQRLNAIFEFIENRYGVEGKYFRVEELSRAQQRLENGVFPAIPREFEKLDREACSNLLDYTLAITEFPASDSSAVNEVFGRINAYGRRLSDQEQRQAGVVSEFASLVRTLSAEIRGDVSRETLDLSEMPSISIEPDEFHDTYGIAADETFWCNQGVLRKSQLREAEDEQFVADLVISILNDEPFAFSGANLDAHYNLLTDEAQQLERSVHHVGADTIKANVLAALNILLDLFREHDANPGCMKRVLNPNAGSNPIKAPFYAVFMAFYELCVEDEKSPGDVDAIVAALTDLQNKLNVARGQVTAQKRRENIDLTKGLISRYFDDRRPPSVNTGAGLGIQFCNALRRSKVETAAFECKQGVLELHGSRQHNEEVLQDVIQTICAIANLGPDSDGAVFIGVADSQRDASRIHELDEISETKIGARYVVGIDREAKLLDMDVDTYVQRVCQAIATSPLSEPLKSAVMAKVDCIDFRNHSVITIWIPSQKVASTLSDQMYIREGSSTVHVDQISKITAVQSLFQRG